MTRESDTVYLMWSKEKNLQQRILYLEKLSFRVEEKIKTFTAKQKLSVKEKAINTNKKIIKSKVISFYTAKKAIQKMKVHRFTKQKKIFANDAINMSLIFKICKQLTQLNNNKKQPNQKMRRPK